jgi:hypothetical protein
MLTSRGQKSSLKATLYISWVAAVGLTVFATGIVSWQSTGLWRFVAFLFLAQLVSTQKISLPGMQGTMSPSFLFMLIGIADFSFSETLVLGCTAAFVQTIWKAKHTPRPEQVIFNISTLVLCAGFSGWMSHKILSLTHISSPFVLLAIAAFLFLVLNTALVSVVVSLTEQKPLQKEWLRCFYWSFPYFFAGALAAGSVSALSRSGGWPSGLLVLPLIYLCHLWYKVHVANAARTEAFLDRVGDNTGVVMPEPESVLAEV